MAPIAIVAQTGLNFDGVDDYVQSAATPVTGSAERTIEAWIKTTKNSLPINQGGDGQSVISDWGYASTGARFTFNVLWSNAIRLEVQGNGVSGSIPVNDGEWHHVAVVYNPSAPYEISLYVDGELDTQNNLSVGVNTSTITKLRLGKRVDDNGLFQGEMDEYRIWNIALSQAEIQERMNTELCGDETGLLVYYPFNEGIPQTDNSEVDTVTDLGSLGESGTLNNFALNGSSSNWTMGADITGGIDNEITLAAGVLTATETGATYQWFNCGDGNSAVEGATAQTFTPETSGTYAVEITSEGCVTTSTCMYVDASLGIEDTLLNATKLYPNPTKDMLTLELANTYETIEMELVSVTGKIIGKYQYYNDNKFLVDLQGVATGLYFLRIEVDGHDSVAFKVIKE